MFSYNSSNEIKETGLNRFYSTKYYNWKQDAIDIYTRVNEALKNVNGAYMVNHEILGDELRAVTYSNGVKIYVNKSDKNQSADGITIPARSYVIGGDR
jgi:hypothetical protein